MNKQSIARLVRNVLLSTAVLLVLSVGGGIGYTWYGGQSTSEAIGIVPVSVTAAPAPMAAPAPAPNTLVSASVQSLTSPVTRGSSAEVTVRTLRGSKCSITVIYDKIASTDSGLGPKAADEYGMVSWTWVVGSSVPLGKWPVSAKCVNGNKSAVVTADLLVQSQP